MDNATTEQTTNNFKPAHKKLSTSRIATVIVCLVAGFMMTVSAINARGNDLRPEKSVHLGNMVADQANQVADMKKQIVDLRTKVKDLSNKTAPQEEPKKVLNKAEAAAGLTPVKGPAVKVVLKDAPLNVKPDGIHDDSLVVHQQDIQAVVNAMWAGGAEAVMIQKQRIISTTGIKCVGNSVVLHGVPYTPPYEIVAIGKHKSIEKALDNYPRLKIYRQYADLYGLGYAQTSLNEVTIPGYNGSLDLTKAINVKN